MLTLADEANVSAVDIERVRVTLAEESLVRSLQRGLRVLNAVGTHGPLHAKLVARMVGAPLPTTYHLLRTLVHDGYVARLDDGTYVLGQRIQVDGLDGRAFDDAVPVPIQGRAAGERAETA